MRVDAHGRLDMIQPVRRKGSGIVNGRPHIATTFAAGIGSSSSRIITPGANQTMTNSILEELGRGQAWFHTLRSRQVHYVLSTVPFSGNKRVFVEHVTIVLHVRKRGSLSD